MATSKITSTGGTTTTQFATSIDFEANSPQDFTIDLSKYSYGVVIDVIVINATSGAQKFNIVRTAYNKFRIMSSTQQKASLIAIIMYY